MRACFLGQSICGLGYGIATLHTPMLVMDHPAPESLEGALAASTVDGIDGNVSAGDVRGPLPPFADTVCSKFATADGLIQDHVPPYNC